MNILLFQTTSLHCLNLAIHIFAKFAVSAPILIIQQPVPLQQPLYIPNLTNVTLYYNLPKSQLSRLQQIQNSLACVVVKAPKFSHTTPIFKSIQWLKINERRI